MNAIHPTQDEPTGSYPEIYDQDEIHPAFTTIKNGGRITAIKLESVWMDDHVPCAGVTATIDSKEYKWSEWWCDLEGVVLYSKAEISQEYRDKLTKNIQEYVMPENDEKE